MENMRETQEAVKADVEQLKEQISQILEALRALLNSEETSAPPHQPRDQMIQTFPPYGLPSSYIPPIKEDMRQAYTQKTVDHISVTHIRDENELGATALTELLGNVQPNVVQVASTKEPEMKPPHYAAISVDVEATNNKLEMLEKRIRVMEGGGSSEFENIIGLSLAPNVVIPPKFKSPEFEKYRGTTCPKSHIMMYGKKMAAHAHNEKLLIHVFQDSLAGMALNWYVRLEPSRIQSWKDLVDAFMKQYEYNMNVAPDRLQLQNMVKKESESFREYAQRWREIAAQVEPPLNDKEMVNIFLNTLRSPFYEHMISSVCSNLADIVIIGERVEGGIRSGKIALDLNVVANLNEHIPRCGKNKEQIANPHLIVYPQRLQCNEYNQAIRKGDYKQEKKVMNFTHIPMTYTEILPYLLCKNLIKVCPTRPVRPPYPKNYDVNARCDYHGGVSGHSTETCGALKRKVQSLMDSGRLTFGGGQPDVEENPPLGHENSPT